MNQIDFKLGFAQRREERESNPDPIEQDQSMNERRTDIEPAVDVSIDPGDDLGSGIIDVIANTDGDDAEPVEAEAEQSQPQPGARLTGALAKSDADLIMRLLHSGQNRVAKQSDLVRMHKNLVENMRTLGEGVGDQAAASAAADRQMLSDRIDEMERSVNGMEAVLRIQLAPEIQGMIDNAFAAHQAKSARRPARAVGLGLVAGLFLAVGVVLSSEIKEIVETAVTYVQGIF